jgi:hypothetical protein
MPRKSRAELGVVPAFKSEPVPVQPPETLSEPARKVFLDLVSHCNPTHFEQSDVTLLGQYAEASALAARSVVALQAGDTSQLLVWEKASRCMSNLALRLRLGPQSRRERAKVERPLTWDEKFRLEKFGQL